MAAALVFERYFLVDGDGAHLYRLCLGAARLGAGRHRELLFIKFVESMVVNRCFDCRNALKVGISVEGLRVCKHLTTASLEGGCHELGLAMFCILFEQSDQLDVRNA